VSARSGWSGDESLVVFKCGPPIGHEATEKFSTDPGAGHVHPDANHFVVFGAGEWLIRDEGYAWKQTDHHNTLLVDGKGQYGEGVQWFKESEVLRGKLHPRVLKAASMPDVDEIAGDAAPIYRRETGIRRFVRRLLFLKPDALIVVDDIEADGPRDLELRFHPEHSCERDGTGVLMARGRKAQLRMELLTPEGVEVTAGETAGKNREGNPMSLYAVRMATRRSAWRNAVALSWSAAGEPVRVTMDTAENRWTFRAGGRAATI
jgi:hypothetical protein